MDLDRRIFIMSALVLMVSIVFGGATKPGYFGDVAAQIVAIPLLLTSLLFWLDRKSQPTLQFAIVIIFMAITVATFVIHLTPVPPDWLPKTGPHGQAQTGLERIGQATTWRQLSISPHQTWATAASLIVPTAVFAGVCQLDAKARLRLLNIILLLGALSLCIGIFQVIHGPESALRYYQYTSRFDAVGLFANRNHFAALLYSSLMLVAVWIVTTSRQVLDERSNKAKSVALFLMTLIFVLGLLAGLALARSRAGIILAVAAIAAIFCLATINQPLSSRSKPSQPNAGKRIWFMGLCAVLLVAANFGLARVLSRFSATPFQELRPALSLTSLEAAYQALPFGAGPGAFVPVYANIERTSDLSANYANRAHNEFAEVLLETGFSGVILFAIFVYWFATHAWSVWRRANGDEKKINEIHTLLQRSASVVVLLLLVHSLVDYPLRTTALGALFGYCCALLITPNQNASEQNVWQPAVRQFSRHNLSGGVDWPDEWKNPPADCEEPTSP